MTTSFCEFSQKNNKMKNNENCTWTIEKSYYTNEQNKNKETHQTDCSKQAICAAKNDSVIPCLKKWYIQYPVHWIKKHARQKAKMMTGQPVPSHNENKAETDQLLLWLWRCSWHGDDAWQSPSQPASTASSVLSLNPTSTARHHWKAVAVEHSTNTHLATQWDSLFS